MLDKFLKEVVGIAAGKPAEDIASLLNSKKHVNEFLIAKKLDLTINQTRNILYKISDHGLVSSIRKKDKRKGWYTYFWKIEILKSLEFLKSALVNRIDQFQNQINSRSTKQFYICKRCNREFNEENALLHDFICNECGGIFSLKDNTKDLKDLKRSLDKYEKYLASVEIEIDKESLKLDKQKTKMLKQLSDDKLEKRRTKAKETAAKRKANKELAEKSGKKKPAKKVAKKKIVKKKPATKKKLIKKAVKKNSIKRKIVKKLTKKLTSKKKSVLGKKQIKKTASKKAVVKKKIKKK